MLHTGRISLKMFILLILTIQIVIFIEMKIKEWHYFTIYSIICHFFHSFFYSKVEKSGKRKKIGKKKYLRVKKNRNFRNLN